MRKLLFFVLGFAMAIFAGIMFFWQKSLLSFAGFCLLAFLAVVPFACLGKSYRAASAMLLGAAIGFLWLFGSRHAYFDALYTVDGETIVSRIEAAAYSEESLFGYQVDGIVRIEGKPYQVRVYFDQDWLLEPGDILSGTFRFRTTIPDGLKDSSYYQSTGIWLLAGARKDVSVSYAEKLPWCFTHKWIAKHAKEVMESIFPADVLPFAKALMIGDTEDLDYVTDTAFKVSGIRHIIAVSGLHVAILYGLVSTLTGKKKGLTFLICAPVLVLFAAVVGFTPSVSRACIVMILMMLAELIQMEYDPPTALSFAALMLIGVNPFVVRSVGFQLSVGSVAGILLFSRKIQHTLTEKLHCSKGKDYKSHFLRGCCASVSVTMGALAATTPLSLYYFGNVCLVGVVTNLLTLWVVGFIFCGVLLSTAAGWIFTPVGHYCACIVAMPMRYVLSVAKLISRIPYASVYSQNRWIVLWVILCYAMAAFWYLRRKHGRILLASSVAALVLSIILGGIGPRVDDFRLSLLDVGQGQSILLQSDGHTLIVDCGSSTDAKAADMTAQSLLSQSIFSVDGLVLTHYDSDHAGGLANLLTRIRVKTLYLQRLETDWRDDALARSFPGEIVWVEEPMKVSLGKSEVTLITTPEVKSNNENSLGVLFEGSDCAILVTGDRGKSGEKALIQSGLLKDVDVLIAGHHGSKNSTTDELLDAVTPEILMVSAGAGNSYGHPAPEVLKRAQNHGCEVRRTDYMGTIIFRR